jgi:hypothetical protein
MAEVDIMTTVNGSADSRTAPPAGPGPRPHALLALSPAECFDLLELGGIGRVGFNSADGIMMLPVNFD